MQIRQYINISIRVPNVNDADSLIIHIDRNFGCINHLNFATTTVSKINS